VIDWECAQQVFDLMIEDILEDVYCKLQTHMVRPLLVGKVEFLYALQFAS
jgi:hypothetical protein